MNLRLTLTLSEHASRVAQVCPLYGRALPGLLFKEPAFGFQLFLDVPALLLMAHVHQLPAQVVPNLPHHLDRVELLLSADQLTTE